MKKLSRDEEKFITTIKGSYYKKIKDKKHLKNAIYLLLRQSSINKAIIAPVSELKKFINYVYDNGYTSFAMDMCMKGADIFLAAETIDESMDLLDRGNDFYNTKSLLKDVVYHTNDYSIFKFSKVNRAVNKAHVKKLGKSIESDGLTQPILVDSNMIVLDGQHRLSACEQIGTPIKYMLSEKKTTQAGIITVNSMSKSWSSMDYLKSYVAAKKPAYIVVKKYMQKYNTTLSITLQLMGITPPEFRGGNIVLNITDQMEDDFLFLSTYSTDHKAFHNRRFITEALKYFHHEAFDAAKFGRQVNKYPTWLSRSYKDHPDVRKDIRRIMTFKTKESIVKIFNKVEFDVINA